MSSDNVHRLDSIVKQSRHSRAPAVKIGRKIILCRTRIDDDDDNGGLGLRVSWWLRSDEMGRGGRVLGWREFGKKNFRFRTDLTRDLVPHMRNVDRDIRFP